MKLCKDISLENPFFFVLIYAQFIDFCTARAESLISIEPEIRDSQRGSLRVFIAEFIVWI